MMPVASATTPAANHTITQIYSSEIPTESAARWLSATARSARPMRVFWKKTASVATISEAMIAAAISIFCICTKPPSILMVIGAARQQQLVGDHHLGIAAEHQFAEADQEIGQAEGRHEQDDVRLVDQRPQHEALDREAPAGTSRRW